MARGRLDLLGGFQADPVGLLLDQQADLVITSESAPRAGVVYVPLFGFEMLALLPPGHPLASKKWLAPADFTDHTLITYPVSVGGTLLLCARPMRRVRLSPTSLTP